MQYTAEWSAWSNSTQPPCSHRAEPNVKRERGSSNEGNRQKEREREKKTYSQARKFNLILNETVTKWNIKIILRDHFAVIGKNVQTCACDFSCMCVRTIVGGLRRMTANGVYRTVNSNAIISHIYGCVKGLGRYSLGSITKIWWEDCNRIRIHIVSYARRMRMK